LNQATSIPAKLRLPSVAKVSFPGGRLVKRDQLSDRFRGDAGMRQKDERAFGDLGHRDEIAVGVVGERFECVRVRDQRRGGREEERVSVRCRSRSRLCADRIGAAGAILNDNGLPELAGQPIGDDPA